MRFVPALAFGLMLPLGTAMVVAAPAASAKEKDQGAPKPAYSPGFLPNAQAMDKAAKAKDYAALKDAADKGAATATSPDDQFLLNYYRYQLSIGTNDTALQGTSVKGMLASGKAPPELAAQLEPMAGRMALRDGDMDGAIDHLGKASQLPGATGETKYYLAEAYFSKAVKAGGGKVTPASQPLFAQGLVALQGAVDADKAANQPVPQNYYDRGSEISQVIHSPDAQKWAIAGVQGQGSPKAWATLLSNFQDSHRTMTRDENLDVLRLMVASGSSMQSYSYSEYADAAIKSGLPGEAKSVIDTGRSSGVVAGTQLADLYQIANGSIARDKASLPASEADSAKSANGKIAASTASAFLGYGDYAKAVQLYRLALQKGGVDANEVNTRLGIALAKSGDKVGAKAAFSAVTGPGTRKDIADLWLVWINGKA